MGCRSQWENVAIQEGFKTQEGLRIRASHCISDDVGKTGMSGDTPPLKVGRSACIPVGRHKMARNISVDEDHNAICTSAPEWMQDQWLPRHIVGNPRFFCETDEEREYCWAWTALWAWQEFRTKTW